MKQFNGFPTRMQFTPVPNIFFSSLLPQINDIGELKIILYIFRTIYGKKGYPRFISYGELLTDKSLISGLREEGKAGRERLGEALEMAVRRGVILKLVIDRDGKSEDIYFLNTDSDKRAMEKIQNGELVLKGLKIGRLPHSDVEADPPPDIFTLYEQNIGMLTPMIADELREAEKVYPETWMRAAIGEAVSLNKRSWRYIERILENWAAEGRSDGTYRGDFKKADPGKYSKGKYGHMVQR